MKKTQENLTKSSMIYFDCQKLIKEMFLEKGSRKDYESSEDTLECFDILLQIILLKLASNNNILTKFELSFIDLLIVEKDILEDFSKKTSQHYTWDQLLVDDECGLDEHKFISNLCDFYKKDLDVFILFLASIDSYTDENYFELLFNNILKIMLLFSEVDITEAKTDFEQILAPIFTNKYNKFKNLFNSFINKNK
ncbi:MAG: hypothetical protein ACRC5M_03730 [Anaeroplasmataceae bacterium]